MPSAPCPKRRHSGDSGFTLVEAMISATLLGLTVTGVMSMLGSGRSLESADRLQSQAFRVAFNALEDSIYHDTSYASLVARTEFGTLVTGSGTAVPETLRITIGTEASVLMLEPGGDWTRPIRYRTVQAMVTWNFDGIPDTVKLSRCVTSFQ